MEKKGRVTDMTEGPVVRLILWFAIPIFLGNLCQQLYNIVDVSVAGRYLGDSSLAALGAVGSIYSLLINFVWGFTNGFSILVSRAFGNGKEEKVRDSVAQMILLNAVLLVIVIVASVIGIRPLLHVLKTPSEIFEEAYTYMLVIILGLPATVFYNMQASILRALGNSKTPLVYLCIACAANIVLDFLLVAGLKMGVDGLAIATVTAQLISAVLCFIHICRHYRILYLKKENFKIRKDEISEMFTTGLSMALMYSIFSIGTVILQGAINALGEATITAHFAARKAMQIIQFPLVSISNANATFVSQNYGASKPERVKEGVRKSCILTVCWAVIATGIVFGIANWIIEMLTNTDSKEVLDLATKYMYINVPFTTTLGVLITLRTSLQSIGRKITPLISSGIELGAKVVATWSLVPLTGYFGVCIIEPIIWVVCMVWLWISYRIAVKEELERGKIVHMTHEA